MHFGVLRRSAGATIVFRVLGSLALLQLTVNHSPGNELSAANFVREYETNVAPLIHFYTSCTIEATRTESGRQNLLQPRTSDVKVLILNDHLRFDSSNKDQGVEGRVAAPQVSFIVVSPREGMPFMVDYIEQDYARAFAIARAKSRLATAPYGVYGMTAAEYFRSPGLKIIDVSESDLSGNRVIVVKSHYSYSHNADQIERWGRFVFLRDRCWALKEWSAGAEPEDGFRRRTVLEYDGDSKGVPLLKRIDHWRGAGAERNRVDEFVITRIDPRDPSPSDFTLAAFGIPDIQPVRHNNSAYIVVALGVFAIVAGIWLRRRVAAARGS